MSDHSDRPETAAAPTAAAVRTPEAIAAARAKAWRLAAAVSSENRRTRMDPRRPRWVAPRGRARGRA
jgi:hypothetical protein